MSEEKHSLRDRLAPALPTVLLILLILQPLLDILSYWTDRLGMANTLTLLLRFAVVPARLPRLVAQESLWHRRRCVHFRAGRPRDCLLDQRISGSCA